MFVALCPSIPLSPYKKKALISDMSDWKKREAEKKTDCHKRQADNGQVKGSQL